MKRTLNLTTAFWSVTAALILSGCSGAPSEGDIKAAIEKEMQDNIEAGRAAGGTTVAEMMKGMMPKIKNIKKIGCKDDGENAYLCDVEMDVTQMNVTNKTIAPIRL